MAIYVHPWLFIRIPKTGSTSVTKSLERITGVCNHIYSRSPCDTPVSDHFSLQLLAQTGIIDTNKYQYKAFTVVRNPYARMVSIYHHFKKPKRFEKFFKRSAYGSDINAAKNLFSSFNNFLQIKNPNLWPGTDIHRPNIWTNQSEWGKGCQHFFKIEDPDVLLDFFEKQFNSRPILSNENTSDYGDRDYRSFYNEKSYERITKIYARDINLFGYKFD